MIFMFAVAKYGQAWHFLPVREGETPPPSSHYAFSTFSPNPLFYLAPIETISGKNRYRIPLQQTFLAAGPSRATLDFFTHPLKSQEKDAS